MAVAPGWLKEKPEGTGPHVSVPRIRASDPPHGLQPLDRGAIPLDLGPAAPEHVLADTSPVL